MHPLIEKAKRQSFAFAFLPSGPYLGRPFFSCVRILEIVCGPVAHLCSVLKLLAKVVLSSPVTTPFRIYGKMQAVSTRFHTVASLSLSLVQTILGRLLSGAGGPLRLGRRAGWHLQSSHLRIWYLVPSHTTGGTKADLRTTLEQGVLSFHVCCKNLGCALNYS